MSELAAALNAVVDQIVKTLLEQRADLRAVVVDVYSDERAAAALGVFLEKYPTDEALRAGLQAGAEDLRECAIQLLARCDPAAALPLGCAIKDTTKSLGGWNVKDPLASKLDDRAALSLNECAHLLPMDDLVARLRRGQFSYRPAMASHEALQSAAGRLRALEQCLAPGREIGLASDLVTHLMPLAIADRLPELEGVLSKAWLEPGHRYQAAAAEALLQLATPTSLATVAGWVDRFFDGTELPPTLAPGQYDQHGLRVTADYAVRGAFAASPGRELDRLGGAFADAALSSTHGRFLAHRALIVLPSKFASAEPTDPRWPATLVGLLGRMGLEFYARRALAGLPKKVTQDALAAAGVELRPRAPVTKRAPTLPAAPRWHERYVAGEQREVWQEMRQMGAACRDPALLPEVEAVARETMRRVRASVEALVIARQRAGAKQPPLSKILGRPAANTAAQIARLEKAAGALPVSLRSFYEIVVSISLSPVIVVSSPVAALAGVSREKQWNRAVPAPLRRGLHAWVAPGPEWPPQFDDDVCPYRLPLPDEGADGRVRPPLAGREAELFFVDFLRARLSARGLPPLAQPF